VSAPCFGGLWASLTRPLDPNQLEARDDSGGGLNPLMTPALMNEVVLPVALSNNSTET
jgi:hypothetical protein